MRVEWDIARRVQARFSCAILLAAAVLAVPGAVCFGQTNTTVAAAHLDVSSQAKVAPPQGALFPPPELKLHDLPFKQESAINPLPHGPIAYSGQMDSEISAAQARVFRRIDQDGQLKPPTAMTDMERKMDAAFKPKILHVGRVRIYSPIITAIARKNPLCLLDPMVLGISF